jgi:hypothetical protein
MVRRILVAGASIIVLCVVLGTVPAAQRVTVERARFWTITPYEKGGDSRFPEAEFLPANLDIGIAFSGGGVRSASATVGELRGLEAAGLLPRVRYASAVSGGSWGLIPWTYSGKRDLLGTYKRPEELTFEDRSTNANGTMVAALTDIDLVSDVINESVLDIWKAKVPDNSQQAVDAARKLLKQAEQPSQVYTTLLAHNLIGRLVDQAQTSDFVWNDAQEQEMHRRNAGLEFRNIVRPQDGRPFIIVNANILNVGHDLVRPEAVPLEITPLYVGGREQIGGVFGGLYTWPMAYNATTARISSDAPDFLEVTRDSAHPRLTLADAAASSGAAPLFLLAGGSSLPTAIRDFVRTRFTSYFPNFTHIAQRGNDVLKPTVQWPHADGGARDNLGVMALLARKVKHVIVFDNTDDGDFQNNLDIRSLFIEGDPEATKDRRSLVVLKNDPAAQGQTPYETMMHAFADARAAGRPLVHCGTYEVIGNRLYNVQPYEGVSICWVFPDRSTMWVNRLADQKLKALILGPDPPPLRANACNGRFDNFPWYETFYQNGNNPFKVACFGVLRLTKAQVNLLADLMSWTVVVSASSMTNAFR